MKSLKLAILLCACLGFTACDKNDKGGDKKSSEFAANTARFEWSPQTSENAEITVLSPYGEPVRNAQILIGDAQGSPFRNNLVVTDGRGIAVVPTEWTSPASVTVQAHGYIRSTFLNQAPGNITIRVNTAYLSTYPEVKGNVTGLPVVNSDKLIDFALAMPVFNKRDLLHLDLGQVISPYSDTLSAAGQSSPVPSNLSLPKQTENYFINVTLNKPVYRMKVPTLGPKKFVAVRGRFVFKTVVGELRNGKPFHETINHFSFHGGGMRDVAVTGDVPGLDIPGTEMVFNAPLQVTTPDVQADEVALVISASELNGNMIPTDVKRGINGKTTTLQTLPSVPTYIVNVLKKQAEFMSSAPGSDRMSVSMVPYTSRGPAKFLPLIESPTITNNGQFVISMPAVTPVAGISALATSAIISDLVEITDGKTKFMNPIRKWEIIGHGWNSQLTLPKWPMDAGTGRRRVEVNYIGSSISRSSHLDNATHVTHASADF